MSADDLSAIAAQGLAASYGPSPVWSEATFTIEEGELIAVLGPNGAGKSTLLRMVLGLLPPTAGRLSVLGQPPRRGNPSIGYVPQRHSVDPDVRLAGTELVRLGVDGHRWGIRTRSGRKATDARVAAAIADVGAAGYADRGIGSLSGGELQRLMLAQAIVSEPKLLLLDEPLANLDVHNQIAVAGLVSRLAAARGLTVLLIAHDINPLLSVLDRVIYIARGGLTIGTPSEVITAERLSALYQTDVEVLTDSKGRVFVVGLEDEAVHPHGHEHVR